MELFSLHALIRILNALQVCTYVFVYVYSQCTLPRLARRLIALNHLCSTLFGATANMYYRDMDMYVCFYIVVHFSLVLLWYTVTARTFESWMKVMLLAWWLLGICSGPGQPAF